jgi:hypothetical protein
LGGSFELEPSFSFSSISVPDFLLLFSDLECLLLSDVLFRELDPANLSSALDVLLLVLGDLDLDFPNLTSTFGDLDLLADELSFFGGVLDLLLGVLDLLVGVLDLLGDVLDFLGGDLDLLVLGDLCLDFFALGDVELDLDLPVLPRTGVTLLFLLVVLERIKLPLLLFN